MVNLGREKSTEILEDLQMAVRHFVAKPDRTLPVTSREIFTYLESLPRFKDVHSYMMSSAIILSRDSGAIQQVRLPNSDYGYIK